MGEILVEEADHVQNMIVVVNIYLKIHVNVMIFVLNMKIVAMIL